MAGSLLSPSPAVHLVPHQLLFPRLRSHCYIRAGSAVSDDLFNIVCHAPDPRKDAKLMQEAGGYAGGVTTGGGWILENEVHILHLAFFYTYAARERIATGSTR